MKFLRPFSVVNLWRPLAAASMFVLGSGVAFAGPDDGEPSRQAPTSGYLLETMRPSASDMSLHPAASAFQLKPNVVPSGTLNVGPVVTRAPSRGDFSDSAVDPLSPVDPAWEAGAFVDYRMDNGIKPSTVVGLNLRMSPGVSDSRAGWLFLPNVYYQTPLGNSWNIRADLSSTFATDGAVGGGGTGFGTTAIRHGLEGVDGEGGFRDVGIGVGVTYNLTPSWDVDTALRYQRLLDEAADNSAANDPGAANHLFGGVLVRYKF